MSALVTVLPHAQCRSWPTHELGAHCPTVALSLALTRRYSTDAHLAAYASPRRRRLSHGAIAEGVTMHALIYDLDGPEHVASREWRRDTRDRVQQLAADHPGLYYFETRGGARIVYRLPIPWTLRTEEDSVKWSRQYHIAISYLERRYGISADRGCAEWQRLYRLPDVVRDGVRQQHPSWGDPGALGALEIEATREDVEAARAAAPRLWPRAHQPSRPREWTGATASGDGLLYDLLRAQGMIGEQRGEAIVVLCPGRAEHTTDTDWSSSTVLYPRQGDGAGRLVCLHAHCRERTVRQWLELLRRAA